ncbi:MAG: FmdB family zinc ribbon protein [Acidimicrobiales bacterium]
MPTYVYKCLECSQQFDVQQSFSDATLTEHTCPSCGQPRPVRKVFTPVGVTFKGSGFYKTDSRGSGSKSAGSSGGNGGASGSSSESSSSDSAPSSSSTSSESSSGASSSTPSSGSTSSTGSSTTSTAG